MAGAGTAATTDPSTSCDGEAITVGQPCIPAAKMPGHSEQRGRQTGGVSGARVLPPVVVPIRSQPAAYEDKTQGHLGPTGQKKGAPDRHVSTTGFS